MSGHDDLCRCKHMTVETNPENVNGCDCALIARVREDEKHKADLAISFWEQTLETTRAVNTALEEEIEQREILLREWVQERKRLQTLIEDLRAERDTAQEAAASYAASLTAAIGKDRT